MLADLDASCYPLNDGNIVWKTQVVNYSGHAAGPVTICRFIRKADENVEEHIDNGSEFLPVFVEIMYHCRDQLLFS